MISIQESSFMQKFVFLLILLIMFNFCSQLFAQQPGPNNQQDLFEMSLQELMDIEIVSPAALTKTTRRLEPATVITITQEQIRRSGARNLNELLEIYVPNLQMIRHHWENRHLGLRGIINDREEKYLLLVNNRIMNERTHYGVLSERDLSMLTDIHHIDIVRGPGSAIYGPGAVSMVINIVTDNAMTFEGTEVTGRFGAIEEFYSGEVKYGQKFSEDSGLFLYFGTDKYIGADQKDSPLVFGTSFNDFWLRPVEGGKPFPYQINNDFQAYRDLNRIKSHIQYTKNNFDVWARYTRGGELFTFCQSNLARAPYGWMDDWAVPDYPSYESFQQPGSGYQQATVYAGYKQEISDNFTVSYAISFDTFDFERASFDSAVSAIWDLSHREDEYYAKVLANWEINERHLLAFGGEWSYEQWGMQSPGFPGDQACLAPYVQPPFNGNSPRWNTNTVSAMAEHQWKINNRWTTFIGGRLDKNTHTHELFSPRFTVVCTPTDKDTLKLMLARSLRMTFAEEIQWQWQTFGKKSDPETLDSIELRYERQHTPNLLFALGAFYHDLDVIAWDPGAWGVEWDAGTKNIGELQQFGLEAEMTYEKDSFRFTASHGYTKLANFSLMPGAGTALTAEPYGYGDDLANWSNHITKLVVGYQIDDKLRIDGSARIYWGFPGAKDYANYVTDNNSPIAKDPGYDDPYGPSIFLNIGIQHQPSKNLTVRLDAYNLMGLINRKYNKTLYGFNEFSDYRASSPAIGLSAIYRCK